MNSYIGLGTKHQTWQYNRMLLHQSEFDWVQYANGVKRFVGISQWKLQNSTIIGPEPFQHWQHQAGSDSVLVLDIIAGKLPVTGPNKTNCVYHAKTAWNQYAVGLKWIGFSIRYKAYNPRIHNHPYMDIPIYTLVTGVSVIFTHNSSNIGPMTKVVNLTTLLPLVVHRFSLRRLCWDSPYHMIMCWLYMMHFN